MTDAQAIIGSTEHRRLHEYRYLPANLPLRLTPVQAPDARQHWGYDEPTEGPRGVTSVEGVEMKRLLPLLFMALILAPCIAGRGSIEVLCTGLVEGNVAPYTTWFRREPGMAGHYVPARFFGGEWSVQFADRIKRSVRMYFPRSYGQLSGYDFLILDGAVVSYFGDDGIRWIRRAIEEGEIGATTMASILSKHQFVFLPFLLSELADCFPVDGMKVAEHGGGLDTPKLSMAIGEAYGGSFHVRVNRDAPAVFTPFIGLGIERYVAGGGYLIFEKPGSYTWMWAVGAHPRVAPETPYLISWEFGKGLTWSLSDNMRQGWWGWNMPGEGYHVSDNPYGLDILVNWIRYATGREPIQDIPAFHSLRMSYANYDDLRNMLFSVLDFVSEFGGRTAGLEARIFETDEVVAESKAMYVENRLEEADEMIDIALDELDRIAEDSMELKDETLVWIYVTQWLTVTSTALICGFVLWSLMVRRRAYREVGVTRKA